MDLVIKESAGIEELSTQKVAQSLIDFFSQPMIQEVTDIVTLRDGSTEEVKRMEYRPMPMIEEWCMKHRIPKSLLADLEKTSDDVAMAIQFARDAMKVYLVQNGLTRKIDPAFAVFVATNETGMKVKSEVTHNSKKSAKSILDEIEEGETSIIDTDEF